MESVTYLPNPKNDRQNSKVKPPPNRPLPNSLLFPNSSDQSNINKIFSNKESIFYFKLEIIFNSISFIKK